MAVSIFFSRSLPSSCLNAVNACCIVLFCCSMLWPTSVRSRCMSCVCVSRVCATVCNCASVAAILLPASWNQHCSLLFCCFNSVRFVSSEVNLASLAVWYCSSVASDWVLPAFSFCASSLSCLATSSMLHW